MKKTGKTNVAHSFRRIAFTSLLLSLLVCSLSVTVLAASTTQSPSTSIAIMNQKIYTVYRTIRNNIAFPLLSLSFASCGFKILGASILGSGTGVDKGIQSAKEQIFVSVCALLLILALPYLLSFAINLFKGNAWSPPGVVLLPNVYLGGLAI